MTPRVDAVAFDKDGTLFDFRATWDDWAAQVITELSEGDADRALALAQAGRYDLLARRFLPDSPIIAGTSQEAAQCFHSALPDWRLADIESLMEQRAAQAPLVEATPLVPFLAQLASMDLGLGVVTNDSEEGARSHLRAVGVEGMFDFIAGFDSGYGAKPAPDPLLAFAGKFGFAPARVAMVGDSTHDLIAGRAAGMQTIGVLTGPAQRSDLENWADIVLPDISYLLDWIAQSEPQFP